MLGKMQEPGLTEIIPLICTLNIWGQYPVYSHPEFPQGTLAEPGGAAVAEVLAVSSPFVYILGSLRARSPVAVI